MIKKTLPSHPVFSIIMPAYNAARYIDEAINSIVGQSYQMWECLIVDNGSSDNTFDIAKTYAQKDARIQIIRTANNGPAAARNSACKVASGTYISFLDADDVWFSTTLSEQLVLLEKGHDFVVGGAEYIDSSGKKMGRIVLVPSFLNHYDSLSYLLLAPSNKIALTCAVAMRKSVFDRLGGFDESLANAEDWDLWLRAAWSCGVATVEKPLFFRRKHESSQTSILSYENKVNNEIRVIDKIFSTIKHLPVKKRIVFATKYAEIAENSYNLKFHRMSLCYSMKALCLFSCCTNRKLLIKIVILSTLNIFRMKNNAKSKYYYPSL